MFGRFQEIYFEALKWGLQPGTHGDVLGCHRIVVLLSLGGQCQRLWIPARECLPSQPATAHPDRWRAAGHHQSAKSTSLSRSESNKAHTHFHRASTHTEFYRNSMCKSKEDCPLLQTCTPNSPHFRKITSRDGYYLWGLRWGFKVTRLHWIASVTTHSQSSCVYYVSIWVPTYVFSRVVQDI